MARYDNILDTIGRTPVVRVRKFEPPGVQLFVKLEAFNPMGSVKDRLALGVIEAAEASGALRPGQTVIEATSGNTGIGLAMVCAQKGYPLVVTMGENFSVELRRLLRFLGARVVLTPAAAKGSGMLAKAVELAEKHGWFLCRQFENEANADMHTRTTAEEIVADFDGERLDYWVTGFGTGGTLKGVARVLKAKRPGTKVVVCEPDNSQILGSGLPQKRESDGTPSASHPSFRPHLMQGWGPDFIPKLTEDAVAMQLIDELVPVNGNDALRLAQELAQKEGIFCGISGGATFAGALAIARGAPAGASVLAMLPDTGERYLTTTLFESVPEDMSDAELEISRSTPGYRFDVVAAAASALAADDQPLDAAVERFVDEIIADTDQPVVLFALEWCEFCWSVRRMLARYRIPFRGVDLDSVEYQQNNRGGEIRRVLAARLGTPTIPQIYVGGEHVGGCTEFFDAFRTGDVQRRFDAAGVHYDAELDLDPYSFLPKWLHPR